jgi:hypothetical protein
MVDLEISGDNMVTPLANRVRIDAAMKFGQ